MYFDYFKLSILDITLRKLVFRWSTKYCAVVCLTALSLSNRTQIYSVWNYVMIRSFSIEWSRTIKLKIAFSSIDNQHVINVLSILFLFGRHVFRSREFLCMITSLITFNRNILFVSYTTTQKYIRSLNFIQFFNFSILNTRQLSYGIYLPISL